MTYATCAMVAGRIANLINGASDIENTCITDMVPASATIITFMSGGCALIEGVINSMGYAAPGADGVLADYLGDIEADYAAWRAELSRSSPRTAKGERSRADDFRKAYEAALRQLKKMDLSMMGLTPRESAGSGWYSGGISDADKSAVEGDSDRVRPAFERGKFENPTGSDSDDQT